MVISPAVIAIISAIVSLCMGITLILISGIYPNTIKGPKMWGISCLMLSATVPMFLLRGYAPELISIVLANFLIFTAYLFMCKGCEYFLKTNYLSRNKIILLLASFLFILIWFTYANPNVDWRIFFLGAYCTSILGLQIKIFRDSPKSVARMFILVSTSILLIAQLSRCISVLLGFHQPQSIYDVSVALIIYVSTPSVLVPLMTIGFILLICQRYNQNLSYISRHDGLTGSLNKKAFLEVLEDQILHAKRYKTKFSLVMMDLDDFKSINDQFGHLMGDAVLKDFVDKAKTCLRETDYIARFGGDEFVAILTNTEMNQAKLVVERIEKLAASTDLKVTWSISSGISEWMFEEDTVENVINRADKALYISKTRFSAQFSNKQNNTLLRNS